MRYKQLGKTGLEISVIGIGGGVFNPSKDPLLTEEKVREALSLWIEGGVNVLDWGKFWTRNYTLYSELKQKPRRRFWRKSRKVGKF